jgi:signal transduction histidine kinase
MEFLGWIVAGIFAALALILWRRAPQGAPTAAAPAQPRSTGPSKAPALSDAEVVDAIGATLAYLSRTVIADLRAARGTLNGAPGTEALVRALERLEDLAVYAEGIGAEEVTEEELGDLVWGAIRDYTTETRIPVRFHRPEGAVQVQVRKTALQDAIFFLLANAGRFSHGKPIDVHAEALDDGGFRIRIVDSGPGFSQEAQTRAFEPFWGTDPEGVGLGLPQARARVQAMKGTLSFRNQESGGAEVKVEVPGGRGDRMA